MAKFLCHTAQLFCRATIDICRATNTFCRKLCFITLRRFFLRVKVKVYLFSVSYVFLTSCNICERAVSLNIVHLHSWGGGGVIESMDRWGCAILALNWYTKISFLHKFLTKILFYKILYLPFQQGKLERAISFVSHE